MHHRLSTSPSRIQGPRVNLVLAFHLIAGLELLESLAVALGWDGELGVSDGGAVASQIDGIHDCEGAAYAEAEAQKEPEDCGPVYVHYDWSLSSSVLNQAGVLCGHCSGLQRLG